MQCFIFRMIIFVLIHVTLSFGGRRHELFTHTLDYTGQQVTILFWMEAVEDGVWDWDQNTQTQDMHRLSSEFNKAYVSMDGSLVVPNPVPENYYDVNNIDGRFADNYGLFHVTTDDSKENVHYGYGLYKLSVGFSESQPRLYFYLDFRDCEYPEKYSPNDMWIRYDPDNNAIEISWDNWYFPFGTGTIVSGSQHPTFKIWEWKDKQPGYSGQNTEYFELFLDVSKQNNRPYLSWNSYDDRSGSQHDVDHYEIWKKKGSGWYKKANTTNTHFLDTSEIFKYLRNSQNYVHYKIRAIENNGDESIFGNIVKVKLFDYPGETEADDSNEHFVSNTWDKPSNYSLNQNFPNPFNPTTKISFEIPKDEHVLIEVYDASGRIVKTLLNDNMASGNHNIEFAAQDFSSGVYFYKIQAGDFQDMKKMILLK